MDHLAAVSRRSESVPYLGMSGRNPYVYDNTGFYAFPDRHGGSTQALLHGNNIIPLERASLESFLQAWLYFGLLGEFSTQEATVPLRKFYTYEAGLPILRTTFLLEYLENWRNSMLQLPEFARKARQMKIALVLKDAKTMVTGRIATATQPPWAIDALLATSFMVLGETLTWAVEQLEKNCGPRIFGWTGIHTDAWGPSSLVFDRLRAQRWCPYSISMLQGLLKHNVSGLYFASTYPTSPDQRDGRDHAQCTSEACIANRMDFIEYRMRHVDPSCICTYIGANQEAVIAVLEEDLIPLVYLTGSPEQQTATLQVEPYKPGMRFVVVSHVWADGLGNPRGNGMVACQLSRLRELAGKLLDFAGGPVFFWIDTLLIPIESRAHRAIAIRQMHEVYANAYKTIVLDADLMTLRVGGGDYIEIAMRITICGWMQRLWTLQEGVMSRSIYFLFEDGLQDIEDLDLNYPMAATKSSVASAARAFYTNLLRPHSLIDHIDTKLISAMWKALQWRRTSKLSDETMALARILDVDAGELLRQEGTDERMGVLVKSMPEIPPAFIFLPGSRLPMKGFRWAPSTWMVGREMEFPDPLSLPSSPMPFPREYNIVQGYSVLTPDGLMVRYPGYILHSFDLPGILYNCSSSVGGLLSFKFPSSASLHEWYQVQPVLGDKDIDVTEDSKYKESPQSHLAIILCRPRAGVTPEIAILAVVMDKSPIRDTAIRVGMLSRIQIRLLSQTRTSDDTISPTGLTAALKLRPNDFFMGEELDEEQLWVVD
jgi:hypothetical protein